VKSRLIRTAAAGVVAIALSFFVTVPRVHADDDRGKCQHAVEKAEARLDRAIQKSGERSHEADERRRDLNAERQRCWDQYHQWWNGKDRRWEMENNWDRDHDDHHDEH